MPSSTRENNGRGKKRNLVSDDPLTPEARERLAQLALAAEASANVGEALEVVDRRLASWTIRSPGLTRAVEILRSSITTWRRAHDQLARCTMDKAQRYEDAMCAAGK